MGKCIIIKKITSKGGGGVSESVQNQVHTIDYQYPNNFISLSVIGLGSEFLSRLSSCFTLMAHCGDIHNPGFVDITGQLFWWYFLKARCFGVGSLHFSELMLVDERWQFRGANSLCLATPIGSVTSCHVIDVARRRPLAPLNCHLLSTTIEI